MDLSNLVWLAFVVTTAVLPAVRNWLLARSRRALIARLERRRGSRVISLVHRQETLSFLGLPIYRYIDVEDSERVLREIRATPVDRPIDLVLHTPGGLVLAAEQIALALRSHGAPVTVMVPHYAMSGGTLLALAGQQIVMDPNAVLGPVDPQLGNGLPAASLLRLKEQKPAEAIADQTLIYIDLAEKAMRQVRGFVAELLRARMEPGQADELATVLTDGRWTHDYPLTAAELNRLGLPVTHDLPAEVYRLMDLFPAAGSRRPSTFRVAPAELPAGERAS